ENAAGVFTFNPQTYSEGVHTIAWSVSDTGGQTDGIGSRFFTITSAGGGSVTAASTLSLSAPPIMAPPPRPSGMPLPAEVDAAPWASSAFRIRRGFDLSTPFRTVRPTGHQAVVNGEELD